MTPSEVHPQEGEEPLVRVPPLRACSSNGFGRSRVHEREGVRDICVGGFASESTGA